MIKYKILNKSPPSELLKLIEQIQDFQTPRLAKELWDMEENLLKKEKLWGSSLSLELKSGLGYFFWGDIYRIEHRRYSFLRDYLSFFCLKGSKRTSESVNLYRLKDYYDLLNGEKKLNKSLNDFIHGKIASVLILKGEEQKNYVEFEI